ncbi:MAG: hypothetical protein V4719_18930 [Planctomycetota bacterium]
MRIVFRAHVFLIGLLAGVASAQEPSPLRNFTEAAARVVWVQDFGPANSDILATGQRLKLMGIDSEDGRGERVLLAELRNYAKPLLTPDGQRVVYSDQQNQKFYVVNWDGTGKKLLGDGLAVDVWRDPQDGVNWVYAAKRVGKPENVTYRNLRRVKLDEPKTSQKVWDQTEVGCDNFQLSADGTRAGGEFPWPNGGVADLKKKTWQKLEQGCWSSIAPDNSGLSWVFDGPHRNLQFHRPDETAGWKVNVNSAPDIHGAEVFHPRWSNHVRYLGLTGPYSVPGKVNVISGGGPQVEIYLGRFSPDFKTVEAWLQVTKNGRGDFYPDVWIEGGETTVVELPGLKNTSTPSPAVASTWPAITDGLMFAWNNSSQTNQLPGLKGETGKSCQISLLGRAFPGRFHDLHFEGGTGTLDDLNESLLAAVKSSQNLTLEMLVTPTSIENSRGTVCEIGPALQPYIRLQQDGGQLRLEVQKVSSQVTVPEWKTPSPVVLSLMLSAQNCTVFADGRQVARHPVTPDFARWMSSEIRLGSPSWRGNLEAVTVYSRSLSPVEIKRQAEVTRQRLARRKSIARTRIEAKCIERSTIPPPAQILPYRRAMAVHEFEVQKVVADPVLKGDADLKVGARILVVQWVILDGKILPEAGKFEVGESSEFVLELVDEHPELKSERQILDVAELDLPLYYDVNEVP